MAAEVDCCARSAVLLASMLWVEVQKLETGCGMARDDMVVGFVGLGIMGGRSLPTSCALCNGRTFPIARTLDDFHHGAQRQY
jgi:hypothetical protein